MRQTIFTALLSCMAFLNLNAAKTEVYVLTGQSNSLGIIKDGEKLDVTSKRNDKKIKFFWVDRDPRAKIVSTSKGKISHLQVQKYDDGSGNGHWSLEITCFRDLYKKGHRNIMLIKASRGGGGNSLWSKDSSDHHMYDAVISAVKEATDILIKDKVEFEIKGLLYLQGESDGSSCNIADQRAKALLENLRSELPNAQKMKMFIGGIAGTGSKRETTRAKHEELAKKDKDIFFISTKDLLKKNIYKDNIHFNNKAKHEIGKRFAKVIHKNIKK